MVRAGLAGFLMMLSAASVAQGATVVPWGSRMTVDSDGDGLVDLLDNAPGTYKPDQTESDMDGIGDIIDPTPFTSNPALGDPGLGLYGPYTIPVGTHAFVDYQMLTTPPGGWGHIDLDLGGDGIFDATYFGPLTTAINTIDIAPALYADSSWDLNALGTYPLWAKAYGPGMSSENVSITGVTVTVPEPGTLGVLLAGALLALRRRKPALVPVRAPACRKSAR